MMVVDGVWVPAGSSNLHPFSLAGHTELNASNWDAEVARTLRSMLFRQHLGVKVKTAPLDDRNALRVFRDIARAKRDKIERGGAAWQGLVFAGRPETYALDTARRPT